MVGSSVPVKFYEQWNIIGSVFHLSSIQGKKEDRGGEETIKPTLTRQRYEGPEQTCGNKMEESEQEKF